MDRLELKKAKARFAGSRELPVVQIFINGREIDDYLHEIDQLMPLYTWELYSELCLPQNSDLCDPDDIDRHIILQCTCGESGCDNISVKVYKKPNSIDWAEFMHMDRPLSYVKPFSFDKENYQKEMNKLLEWDNEWERDNS